MEWNDLTRLEKFLLRWGTKSPDRKYIEESRLAMNTLASYGLVRPGGNLQYELTPAGEDLLKSIY
jgi:hypothetical protein